MLLSLNNDQTERSFVNLTMQTYEFLKEKTEQMEKEELLAAKFFEDFKL